MPRSTITRAVCIVAAAAALAGCAPADDTSSGTGSKGGGSAQVSSDISAHDESQIEHLFGLPNQWNRAAGPLVAEWANQNGTAEAFLATGATQLEELRSVLIDMTNTVNGIDDPSVRAIFQPIVANYNDKYTALLAVYDAVRGGDPAGADAAQQDLATAENASADVVCGLLNDLRSYASGATLRQLEGQISSQC